MESMQDRVVYLLQLKNEAAYRFWTDDDYTEYPENVVEVVDVLYSLHLVDSTTLICNRAPKFFYCWIKDMGLYGASEDPGVNAHTTAYLLGGIQILKMLNLVEPKDDFYSRFKVNLLLENNLLPKWPKKWSHHSWRVSHWIGGAMSIIHHLSINSAEPLAWSKALSGAIEKCEEKVVKSNGYLKAYESELVQFMFRRAYSLRHSPDLGDIGGIVHLLWIYHCIGRRYVNANNLALSSLKCILNREPFMEKAPYCLDFDVVQLYRTASIQANLETSPATKERLRNYKQNIVEFLSNGKAEQPEYTLHKIPGALSTVLELEAILDCDLNNEKLLPRRDIIKDAFWL